MDEERDALLPAPNFLKPLWPAFDFANKIGQGAINATTGMGVPEAERQGFFSDFATNIGEAAPIIGAMAGGLSFSAARFGPAFYTKMGHSILNPVARASSGALLGAAAGETVAGAAGKAAVQQYTDNPWLGIAGEAVGGFEGAAAGGSRMLRSLMNDYSREVGATAMKSAKSEFEILKKVREWFPSANKKVLTRAEYETQKAKGLFPDTDDYESYDNYLQYSRTEPWVIAAAGQGRPSFRVGSLSAANEPDVIKRMLYVNADNYRKIHAGEPIPLEEIHKLADALHMKPDKVKAKINNGAWDAPHMIAGMDMLNQAAFDVVAAVSKHNEAPTRATREAMSLAIGKSAHLQAVVDEAASSAGLTLFTLKGNRATQARRIASIIERAGGEEAVDNIAQLLHGVTDISQINAATNAVTENPGIGRKFIEAFVNLDLLSGIQTHAVNVGSNAIFNAVNQLGVRPAAAVRGALHGDPDRIYFREIASEIYGGIQSVPLAIRNAGRAFRTEGEGFAVQTNRLTRGGKDPGRSEEVINVLGQSEGTLEGAGPAIGGRLGRAVRTPGRALQAEDEFFKTIIFQSRIRGSAMRRVIDEGVPKEDWAEKLAEYSAKPLKDDMLYAQSQARKLTFTQELGPTGKRVQRAINGNPVFKFSVPFFRTPTNLAKENLHLIPGLTPYARAEFKAGGRRRDLAVAKGGLGAGLLTWAASMAEDGKLSGSMPTNQGERTTRYLEGRKVNSALVGADEDGNGGRWVNIARIQPLGTLMSLGASVYNAQKRGLISTRNLQELGTFIVSTSMEQIGSQTALQGSSDLLEALNEPERKGERYSEKVVSSVLAPAAGAQVARAIDPMLRDARGYVDPASNEVLRNLWTQFSPAVLDRIPFARRNLPLRYDVLGRVESTGLGDGGALSAVGRLAMPLHSTANKATRVTTMMKRVKADVTEPSRFVRVPQEMIPKEYLGVLPDLSYEMNPQQFSEFSRKVGRDANQRLENAYDRIHADSKKLPFVARERIKKTFEMVRKAEMQKFLKDEWDIGRIKEIADVEYEKALRSQGGRD